MGNEHGTAPNVNAAGIAVQACRFDAEFAGHEDLAGFHRIAARIEKCSAAQGLVVAKIVRSKRRKTEGRPETTQFAKPGERQFPHDILLRMELKHIVFHHNPLVAAGRLDERFGIRKRISERFFNQQMLAGIQGAGNPFAVESSWQGNVDGVDVVSLKQGKIIANKRATPLVGMRAPFFSRSAGDSRETEIGRRENRRNNRTAGDVRATHDADTDGGGLGHIWQSAGRPANCGPEY